MRGNIFLNHNYKTGIQRSLTIKSQCSNSTLSGLPAKKKPSELGVSLPSNTGQNGHEKAPQLWLNLWPQGSPVNYRLALAKSIWTTRAFTICLCKDSTLCCCICWPLISPERSSGWTVRNSAPGKLVEQVFRWLDIFRNWFHDPILAFFISRKSLNPFLVTSAPPD